MSMTRPWFKMYPDQFFSATMGWPGDLKAFYSLLIMLIEARNGKIKNDVKMLSRATGYEPKKCSRLLGVLQTLGKCRLDEEISLSNRCLADVCGSQPIEIIGSGSDNKNKNKNKTPHRLPPGGAANPFTIITGGKENEEPKRKRRPPEGYLAAAFKGYLELERRREKQEAAGSEDGDDNFVELSGER